MRRAFLILIGGFALAFAHVPAAGAAPTCEEGPETVGRMIIGTPCADTIRMPRGVTEVFGEGGDDTLYGQRGNDRLNGGDGNDLLLGGIGDDQLRGGPGDDRLSGGFGADSVLDGEGGNDHVRGDATIDDIQNTGGGTDTLSYATGATPGFFNRTGFPDFSEYANFPTTVDGRGAYVNLETGQGDNGRAPHAGGFDESVADSFEVVVGTAFPDYLVGGPGPETFYGGGGADVIIGGGGADTAHGGAEGDSCDAETALECEFGDEQVDPRDPAGVAAGVMAPAAGGRSALYLTGGSARDVVTAAYVPGSNPPATAVAIFTLGAGGATAFDAAATIAGGCAAPAGNQVTCPLTGVPDSIVVAGLGGDDSLTASGFPETTSVVVLGGAGDDEILGGATEDALVDGDGDDFVSAAGSDDAVPNNEGADDLNAGGEDDLFVSDAVCEGDVLDAGPGRDNANWAQFDQAIAIDMAASAAGLVGPGGQPDCGSDPVTALQNLEDIEGTSLGDIMVGDQFDNQLLGRLGPDTYFAGAGDDSILANSGTPIPDPDPTIDCGEGFDTAQIDRPANGPDTAPVGCESVEERAPNSFRPPDTPLDSDPPLPPPVVNPPPPRPPVRLRDSDPPQTRITHHPRRRLYTKGKRRRVVLRFRADERARFRCRVDGRASQRCSSPRAFRIGIGIHTFRIVAIDMAGNADPRPAVFTVNLRRR